MIIIDNIKYACQKCIKGHRSSRCDHTERSLVIVKRKGRPISQCDECREQRLKRHIHQKCVCPKISKKKYLTNTTSNTTKNLNTSRHIMSIEALLLSWLINWTKNLYKFINSTYIINGISSFLNFFALHSVT